MDMKQQLLIAGILAMSFILWNNWNTFQEAKLNQQETEFNSQQNGNGQVPLNENFEPSSGSSVPINENDINNKGIQEVQAPTENVSQIISVETDLYTAKINTKGGTIESLILKDEAKSAKTPDIGFELLKKTPKEIFIAQSGMFGNNGGYPKHFSQFTSNQASYVLEEGLNEINVPLYWTSPEGIIFTKTLTFKRDTYLIDTEFDIQNSSSQTWQGSLYGMFKRTQPIDAKKGSLFQLPSYMGGIQFTPEDKYKKVNFDDISDNDLDIYTDSGWIGMLQHYFVGVWMLNKPNQEYNFFSQYIGAKSPEYVIGFKSQTPLTISPGQSGTVSESIFVGPKEQKRLKKIQNDNNVEGLALTVDYGWLTVIADPLFWILKTINSLVNNWGWSIIILTFLIKLAFFPLSAASYKSMARMKKLQPRMQTLKERFSDDRTALQQEMMKLYKQEKVNPAGGCLPILVQIPVFIALYWVLLESVEMRHAPFALWVQDLSSKDPYYILPILMGASMMLQFRLNPSPMEPMQQKIMMIMPIAMTFLFVTFPSGLVLYWVVNNVLSIAQQWTINRTIVKNTA